MTERVRRARGYDRGADWIAGYPALGAEWHPARNGDLRPEDLSHGSGRKVWWWCAHGPDHEWQASPNNRTSGKSGCPFCAGRAVSVTNSLARHPELVRQWHPTKNGELRPEGVVAGSARPVWWQCSASPEHEWQATPHDRIAGKGGCPFCLGMRVAPHASLAALAPRIAAEWHRGKNGRLTPRDVTPTATRAVWWRCARNVAHEWRAAIFRRAVGAECPACVAEEARCRRHEHPAEAAPGYALCFDSARERRLALVLFLRSRGIDVFGARDLVEARHHTERYGAPRVIVTTEPRAAAEAFPGVPSRAVSPGALRAWIANPGERAGAVPVTLRETEVFVVEALRRASRPG